MKLCSAIKRHNSKKNPCNLTLNQIRFPILGRLEVIQIRFTQDIRKWKSPPTQEFDSCPLFSCNHETLPGDPWPGIVGHGWSYQVNIIAEKLIFSKKTYKILFECDLTKLRNSQYLLKLSTSVMIYSKVQHRFLAPKTLFSRIFHSLEEIFF